MSNYLISLVLLVSRKVSDLYYSVWCAYSFATKHHDWVSAIRSGRFLFHSLRPGIRYPAGFYKRARRLLRGRVVPPARYLKSAVFRALAVPDKIVWVETAAVSEKIRNDLSFYEGDIVPGDWDLDTTGLDTSDAETATIPSYPQGVPWEDIEIEGQLKQRSVVQRYRDGMPWVETDLFKFYASALEMGITVRGARDLSVLQRIYEERFGSLYRSLKNDGFRVVSDEHGLADLPHVHIGRDGRIVFGNNGNHRLALAKLLGITKIPCYVRARHLEWQQLRDRILTAGYEAKLEAVGAKLKGHPDLMDLLDTHAQLPEEVDALSVHADQIPAYSGTQSLVSLARLAAQTAGGTSIVQVGVWLGASSAQLALGARRRRKLGTVALHCYDSWTVTSTDVQRAAWWGVSLSEGESLLPRTQQLLHPFGVEIEFQAAFRDAVWEKDPISLYVDDMRRSPGLFWQALEIFCPYWIPGKTVLVFLNYDRDCQKGAERCTYQEHLVESNPESFEVLYEEGPGVFRYKAQLDFERISAEARVWSLRTELESKHDDLRRLRATTSWKLTKPLRLCSASLQRYLRSIKPTG